MQDTEQLRRKLRKAKRKLYRLQIAYTYSQNPVALRALRKARTERDAAAQDLINAIVSKRSAH